MFPEEASNFCSAPWETWAPTKCARIWHGEPPQMRKNKFWRTYKKIRRDNFKKDKKNVGDIAPSSPPWNLPAAYRWGA